MIHHYVSIHYCKAESSLVLLSNFYCSNFVNGARSTEEANGLPESEQE